MNCKRKGLDVSKYYSGIAWGDRGKPRKASVRTTDVAAECRGLPLREVQRDFIQSVPSCDNKQIVCGTNEDH